MFKKIKSEDKERARIIQSPMLPLRDIVLFPGMVVPLFIGREKSINALKYAMSQGKEIFLATQKNAKDRIVSGADVIDARPDIIVGSWCGKKFVPAKVAARPGFAEVPAVATGWLREIKSTLILQPGPAALTEGLDQLAAIVAGWVEKRPALCP